MCRHTRSLVKARGLILLLLGHLAFPKDYNLTKSSWFMCGYSASDIKKKIILELEVCRQSPVYLRGSLNARFLMERDTGDQSIGKSNCLFWWLKMGLAIRCVSLVVWVAVFEYYCNQSLPELNEAIVHLWPGQPCYCLELQLKWSLAHLSQYSNYPKTLATTIEGFKKKKKSIF